MFDDFEKPIYPEFYPAPTPDDPPQTKPPLPEISLRLRAWRGKRGYREVCPLLSEAIGYEVTISMFANFESGHLERVPETVRDTIATYLKSQ